jgi:hypothetical protein
MPFPYRERRAITYPERGAGWYWAAEVSAAIALWGDRIRVHEGWQLLPDDPEARPFSFITELWELRAAAKLAGAPEQKAYKLALNSLYGKLAQGVGYRGRVPRFRSYVWAGLITSGTRAQLLRMVTPDPWSVIATATDGVLFARDPELPTGAGLGELEHDQVADLFVALSGVYVSTAGERRRGWMRSEIDWQGVLDGWRRDGPFHTQHGHARRFIGLGSALGRTDCWEVWRTWSDVPRRLCLYPSRKSADWLPDIDPAPTPGAMVRWLAPAGHPRRPSDAYVPKTDGTHQADAGDGYVNDTEQPDLAALFGDA